MMQHCWIFDKQNWFAYLEERQDLIPIWGVIKVQVVFKDFATKNILKLVSILVENFFIPN